MGTNFESPKNWKKIEKLLNAQGSTPSEQSIEEAEQKLFEAIYEYHAPQNGGDDYPAERYAEDLAEFLAPVVDKATREAVIVELEKLEFIDAYLDERIKELSNKEVSK